LTGVENELRHTTSFKDDLISDLKDSEFAQHYLQAALADYQQDGDMQPLLLAMRDVAEVQGGIDQLAIVLSYSRFVQNAAISAVCSSRETEY
jgi:DNA-binding phage protein